MNRITSLAVLASLGLVASCASKTEDLQEPAPSASTASAPTPAAPSTGDQQPPRANPPATKSLTNDVEENLKALRDLEVFDVNGIVAHIPEQANCYSLACPGHEQEFADAQARDAEALAAFTKKALEAANSTAIESTPEYSSHCYTRDDENLAALRALDVVSLGDVVEAPESYQAGNCYSVRRARKLARIAVALGKP